MKWIGISGSRQTNRQVEEDVRREVGEILKRGDGIVVGGAMGVDYFASDEVLKQGLVKERLKICLPATLDLYSKHYRKRAKEGVITSKEVETLTKQLEDIRDIESNCLIENKTNTEMNATTYYERNGEIVKLSDELIAFQVNNSTGTQNTIEHAKTKGIPIRIFTYTILMDTWSSKRHSFIKFVRIFLLALIILGIGLLLARDSWVPLLVDKIIEKEQSTPQVPSVLSGCFVGGCSSQICSDQSNGAISTCEWIERYACYQTAKCERQTNGQCGWTETAALKMCLDSAN